jgi:hypothetical protein
MPTFLKSSQTIQIYIHGKIKHELSKNYGWKFNNYQKRLPKICCIYVKVQEILFPVENEILTFFRVLTVSSQRGCVYFSH